MNLKGTIRAGVEDVASRVPLRFIPRAWARTPCLPLYHLVSDVAPVHVKHLYAVRDVATFQADLEYFARAFVPISLSDLVAHARNGRELPPRALCLTFDDGFREVADVIAPLCSRMGVPAAFFLNTASLDNKALCFRNQASVLIDRLMRASAASVAAVARSLQLPDSATIKTISSSVRQIRFADASRLSALAAILEIDFASYLSEARPYLTSDQVRTLCSQGFEIGAHSVDHPLYSELSLADQVRQTETCVTELKRIFGLTSCSFGFPFVSDGVPQDFYDAMLARDVVDLIFCIGAMPAGHPRILQRLWMESAATTPASRLIQRQWARDAGSRAAGRLRRNHPPKQVLAGGG